ncbi:E3 ubiquitin-protein ligase RING1 [Morus notabilis]|uniref:E3 ubiquitin-protein ligase RING1 n=1 Tax=Morus notabilis TaxID=981085 RepID=UPI000CED5C16|nr:E3 ubiquitin-protein ligase RING1 [Morus notabilis]
MSNHNRLLGIFEANLQRSLKNNNIHISREYDNSLVMHIDDDNVVNIINDLWNDNWSVHWELLEDGDDQLPPLIEPLTLFHERLPEVTAAALRSTPAAEPSVEALKRTTYEGSNDDNTTTTCCDDDQSGFMCVICMEEVAIGSHVTRMPCFHLFHGDCILNWLYRTHTCPLCRFELPTSSDYDI